MSLLDLMREPLFSNLSTAEKVRYGIDITAAQAEKLVSQAYRKGQDWRGEQDEEEIQQLSEEIESLEMKLGDAQNTIDDIKGILG